VIRLLWTALRTTPPTVNTIIAVAAAYLLAKIFWLDHEPALFDSAPAVGYLLENFGAAVVVSYIFFLLSFQIPLVDERRRVGRAVTELAQKAAMAVIIFLSEARNWQSSMLQVEKLRRVTVADRSLGLRGADSSGLSAPPAQLQGLTAPRLTPKFR